MSRDPSIYHDLEHLADPFDPIIIDDICFPSPSIETTLRHWAERRLHEKNLLLHGPPGSGKTRAAYALCRHRLTGQSDDWNPIEYVECESGSFDAVFQRLKSMRTVFQCTTDAAFEQFVILDEFDNFKDDKQQPQQQQLKKLLERVDLKFVLITNYINRIDPGIRDRCLQISWHIPTAEDCLPRLRCVANRIGAGVSDDVLVDRVYTPAGWRQMLRNLEALAV